MDTAVVATAAAAAPAQASRVCGGDAESPTGQTGAARAGPTELAFQRRTPHRVPRDVHGVHESSATGRTVPEPI
jgi:hypothetical protein